MCGLPHFSQHYLIITLTLASLSRMAITDYPWWEIGMTAFVSSLLKYCLNLLWLIHTLLRSIPNMAINTLVCITLCVELMHKPYCSNVSVLVFKSKYWKKDETFHILHTQSTLISQKLQRYNLNIKECCIGSWELSFIMDEGNHNRSSHHFLIWIFTYALRSIVIFLSYSMQSNWKF